MRLQNLLKKKRLIIIGLNSGTSADGLDLAAIDFNFVPRLPQVNFLCGKTVPFASSLKRDIHKAINDKLNSIDALIRLDRRLGIFFGEEANRFCNSLKRKGIVLDLIASHGQTIRHLPHGVIIDGRKLSGTLQLGHPESIAAKTGLITVADFRQGDIASGGEGAPITTHAMWQIFSHNRENRLLINIGGIANYFFFPAGGTPDRIQARDCGPGNSLLDIITKKYFAKNFDHEGKIASRGNISMRLVLLLLGDSFLLGRQGHSTGRERFGDNFVEKIVNFSSKLKLNKTDILATATELTAIAIANSIKNQIVKYKIKKAYLLGGGLKNSFLISRLEANLPDTTFVSVKQLGYDPDYLEAICYAVMGGLTICAIPTGLPHITGAKHKAIAGRIILPPSRNE